MTPQKAIDVLDDLVKRSTPKPISEAPKDGADFLTHASEIGYWSNIRERYARVDNSSPLVGELFLPLPDFSPEHAAELAAAIETLRAALSTASSDVIAVRAFLRRLTVCHSCGVELIADFAPAYCEDICSQHEHVDDNDHPCHCDCDVNNEYTAAMEAANRLLRAAIGGEA